MKNIRWVFVFMSVLIAVSIGFYYVFMGKSTFYVKDGILDFNSIEWPENSYMELNGEWEFYYNELIKPGQFGGKDKRYIEVPGIWSRDVEGETYPVKGFGTYRLLLKNIPKASNVALKKNQYPQCQQNLYQWGSCGRGWSCVRNPREKRSWKSASTDFSTLTKRRDGNCPSCIQP